MTRHYLKSMLLAAAAGVLMAPADAQEKADVQRKADAKPATVVAATETADGVRSITLPSVPFELPDAPGKNLVVANCVICHSPSYITMQPAFPRKVWEASVAKMRTTFGAPVPENLVPQIVDYLVAVRGTGEAEQPR